MTIYQFSLYLLRYGVQRLLVEFKNKRLLKLYTEGRSSKYRFPRGVIEKFFMRIAHFEAAQDIYDLWPTASLHFEKLKRYMNRYSVRINESYRLEFDIQWQNREKTVGKIIIIEISKHYER